MALRLRQPRIAMRQLCDRQVQSKDLKIVPVWVSPLLLQSASAQRFLIQTDSGLHKLAASIKRREPEDRRA
jgi:hypothetical protein